MRNASLLLLLAACGGSSTVATVNGTVKGQTISPKDAISAPAQLTVGTSTANVGAVIIADKTSLCGYANANQIPKNTSSVVIAVSDVDYATGKTSAAASTGDFTVYAGTTAVPPQHFSVVEVVQTDASCNRNTLATSTSGKVTLTTNSGGVYAGTYDVTLDSGDRISGSFNPTSCPALTATLAGTPACI